MNSTNLEKSQNTPFEEHINQEDLIKAVKKLSEIQKSSTELRKQQYDIRLKEIALTEKEIECNHVVAMKNLDNQDKSYSDTRDKSYNFATRIVRYSIGFASLILLILVYLIYIGREAPFVTFLQYAATFLGGALSSYFYGKSKGSASQKDNQANLRYEDN